MSEILDQIRQLYYRATAATIGRDFDRAIDLLKSMPSEDDRERAAVFMEGLAEMKKQWAGGAKSKPGPQKAPGPQPSKPRRA
jgi:hypothetical protein